MFWGRIGIVVLLCQGMMSIGHTQEVLVRELLERIEALEQQLSVVTGRLEALEFQQENVGVLPEKTDQEVEVAADETPQKEDLIAQILLEDPDTLYTETLKQIQYGSLDQAQLRLGLFVGQFPDHERMPDILYFQGLVARALKDEAGAAGFFLEGLERYPQTALGPAYFLELAESLFVLGEFREVCSVVIQYRSDYPMAGKLQMRRMERLAEKASCSP